MSENKYDKGSEYINISFEIPLKKILFIVFFATIIIFALIKIYFGFVDNVYNAPNNFAKRINYRCTNDIRYISSH